MNRPEKALGVLLSAALLCGSLTLAAPANEPAIGVPVIVTGYGTEPLPVQEAGWYAVTAWGGSGNQSDYGNWNSTGQGGIIRALVRLEPGNYTIVAGSRGCRADETPPHLIGQLGPNGAGKPGGGSAGVNNASGGGGYSALLLGGENGTPVVIAGGGGGNGGKYPRTDDCAWGYGGHGGGYHNPEEYGTKSRDKWYGSDVYQAMPGEIPGGSGRDGQTGAVQGWGSYHRGAGGGVKHDGLGGGSGAINGGGYNRQTQVQAGGSGDFFSGGAGSGKGGGGGGGYRGGGGGAYVPWTNETDGPGGGGSSYVRPEDSYYFPGGFRAASHAAHDSMSLPKALADTLDAVTAPARDGYDNTVHDGKIVVVPLGPDDPTINKEPPSTSQYARDLESFEKNGITLTLDKANGTYDVAQNGRELFNNAFAAADNQDERLFTQGYESHETARAGDEVIFTHTTAGKPALVQRFLFKEDHLLTSLTIESAGGEDIFSNWISPLYTGDSDSLAGGTHFMQVPYDNDDFVGYARFSVNSVERSSEMTALLNESTGSAVVVGSVTHDTWKTGLEWRGAQDNVRRFIAYGGMANHGTRDFAMPHGTVSGQIVASPTIFIGAFADWTEGLDAYGRANAEIAPPLPWNSGVPMGWNSWGELQDGLTDDKAFAVSDYYAEHFSGIWTQEEEPLYLNLDAWWNEAFGRKLEPHDIDLWDGQQWIWGGDHKKGLLAYVDHCNANGQKAGVYHTPFACWNWLVDGDGKVTDHAGNRHLATDICLTDDDGELLPAWDGAYAFDVTHPAVIEWIENDIQLFLDAGFEYVKLDFLSHGAMEGARYDTSVQTGLQAYNQAMERIRDQIGGQMFTNLSIAPIFPYQYAHGRRLACDTWYDISNTKYMLNSLSYGFWQKNIYAHPDPDHIVILGKNDQAGENEARARVTSGIIAGTSFLAGDDFSRITPGSWQQARVDMLYKNSEIMAVARMGRIFRPAQLPTDSAANIYTARDDDFVYIAVFNFESYAQNFELNLEALAGPGELQVRELWSGDTTQAAGTMTAAVAGKDARVYKVPRVEPTQPKPEILDIHPDIVVDHYNDYIYGFKDKLRIEDIIGEDGATDGVYLQVKGNGRFVADSPGEYVGTGYVINFVDYVNDTVTPYTMVLFGDYNGDGEIDSKDIS
ncbi:MAG: hypothetical protein FWH26_10160, partial [Oscillospiraceae bacterium]|nr:hypothetical protein [Oscillospiraceae bacterium]